MWKLQTVFEKASTDEIDKFHANATKEKKLQPSAWKASTVNWKASTRFIQGFNQLYRKLHPHEYTTKKDAIVDMKSFNRISEKLQP